VNTASEKAAIKNCLMLVSGIANAAQRQCRSTPSYMPSNRDIPCGKTFAAQPRG